MASCFGSFVAFGNKSYCVNIVLLSGGVKLEFVCNFVAGLCGDRLFRALAGVTNVLKVQRK